MRRINAVLLSIFITAMMLQNAAVAVLAEEETSAVPETEVTTEVPTEEPTEAPTEAPTEEPTEIITDSPTTEAPITESPVTEAESTEPQSVEPETQAPETDEPDDNPTTPKRTMRTLDPRRTADDETMAERTVKVTDTNGKDKTTAPSTTKSEETFEKNTGFRGPLDVITFILGIPVIISVFLAVFSIVRRIVISHYGK